jgi:polysaccharide pyruvyl transferase WcaK-like protein/GT2 family glycosyltransferase
MRVVVDQSGYDLLNLGDIAMLQAAVRRLRTLWPDAEIGVVTQAPQRLGRYCPEVRPLGLAVRADPGRDAIVESARAAVAQSHKIVGPYLARRRGPRRPWTPELIDEVRGADAVVAAGGGYVTDAFWWHGAGVMSLLRLAQRLGTPTAMFGQGIGPLATALLRRQAAPVLRSLDVLSLREGSVGPGLVRALGVPSDRVLVTGDDALEVIAPLDGEPAAIGVNVRVAGYSDVTDATAREVAGAVSRLAIARDATVQGLPVSRYERDGDLAALRRAFTDGGFGGSRIHLSDLTTPDALARAAAACRVVVTGSYHAAVFALAQGVPVVCLSGSPYYDGKFQGLAELFAGGCSVVRAAGGDLPRDLDSALEAAWDRAPAVRDRLLADADAQRAAGRDAYARFAEVVEERRRRHAPVLAKPAEAFRATRMVSVDLSRPLAQIDASDPASGARYGIARVLVRLRGAPLGLIALDLPDDGLDPETLATAVVGELHSELADALGGAPIPDPADLALRGVTQPAGASHNTRPVRGAAPSMTVVICTHNRVESLRRSLRSFAEQSHDDYEILIVDNAPDTDDVEKLVQEWESPVPMRRVVEPQIGLSRARNRGVAEARGELIAFVDDDEVADATWLAELAAGFAAVDHVGCVTGMILPASLETPAQAWFEEYGGHSKGRGFQQQVFDTREYRTQHPLYPLPPFGAGGNMAFSRTALLDIGGFDTALGAGTAARGAEDTAAFSDVLLAGYRLVYRPSAIVWHHHYATVEDLGRQLFGYGSGLTAYYARILLRHPRAATSLVPMVPVGLRDFFGPTSARRATISEQFPPEVLQAHRRGLLKGAGAYVSTTVRQRLAA